MRMASLIPAIAKNAQVHVYFIYKGKGIPEETKTWFDSLNITYSSCQRKDRGSFHRVAQRLLMIITMNNFVWFSDEQKDINREIEKAKPDCIWLETPYLVRYFMKIKNKFPVIVDYWGLLSEGSLRDFQFASFRKKIPKWLYWKIASRSEKYYAAQYKWNVSVSKPVSTTLHSFAPHNTFFTIPNGIVKKVQNIADYIQAAEHYDLIMTGDFYFAPNVDAAKYMVKKILPIIKRECPDITLRFSGRNPHPEIKALEEDKCITVTGYVDDILMEIAHARIFVLPLRMGSGIRSKLFDVFPVAKPIVTTSTGAEGLELTDSENCFIADSPELFAQRCMSLLSDEALRRQMGSNILKLVRETYSQNAIEKTTNEIVTQVLEGT